MFLSESEQVLDEGVEDWVVNHLKGSVTISYPLKFKFATKIETLVVSFDIEKP